ncbi:CHAD domain-containing protein [Leifsonia sp. 2MCAF36]|uniref:CHAD domain-containing protein n=1 Tax=Leifsonia sp. 2MCAF36 TaxID=3232988 RepID=UPI003F979AD2
MYALVGVSAELAEQLVAIETGGEDAVHQARTRVRRLRSILSVYRKAFDRDGNRRMRARLKRLGTRLGETRDREVRARDLSALIDAETPPEVAAAVEAMAAEARELHDRALDDLLRQLRSRGHRELMADLQRFAAAPPLSTAGAAHPRRVARKGLRKATARVSARNGETLEERHATRKAARRLRYAADAVTDELGGPAVRLSLAAEQVQDTLGDHRDLILLARHLREHANIPGVELLAADAERRADERLKGLDDALAALQGLR